MTLMLFDDAKGLWMRDECEDGVVPFSHSSVDIMVTDGSGRALNGTLRVNGTPFSVSKGRCKLLTEFLRKVGASDVEFVTEGGVIKDCSYVRNIGECSWFFPTPREALTNDEILLILRRIERLREKLESARSLCSETVSGVLGI